MYKQNAPNNEKIQYVQYPLTQSPAYTTTSLIAEVRIAESVIGSTKSEIFF